MTTPFADRHCSPRSGEEPLRGTDLTACLDGVDDRWTTVSDHHLEAEFSFGNFQEALDFTVRVGALAEEEGHHPDICLSWGKAKITMWTHDVGGLSENDFILAAKIDQVVD